MKRRLPYILPPLVILIGIVTAVGMIKARKPAPRRGGDAPPPLVRVVEARTTDHTFQVTSQGTVIPRTEIVLVAEVSGRVTSVSPRFEPGGFFDQGQTLLTVEPLDYEAAVERARVTLTQSRRRLAEEEALADVARREWERIGKGEPTSLTLREPQLAEARALVASAEKTLAQAQRDLDRTRLRAPFSGRVKEQAVDVGQYVTRGMSVGRIYSVDYAEIRLPLPGRDLAFVDLPVDGSTDSAPEVRLTAEYAGERSSWTGHIVRTEGEIDPRTRMVYAVARVEDPYRPGNTLFPLAPGLFVEASIAGRSVSGVVVLPRSALRGSDQVLVIDDKDRLHVRDVTVLRAESQTVVIGQGLQDGERVCVSPMEIVIDGMKVRTVASEGVPGRDPAPPPVDVTGEATP